MVDSALWQTETEPAWANVLVDPTFGQVTARLEKLHISENGTRTSKYASLNIAPCARHIEDKSEDFEYFSYLTPQMREVAQFETAYCIDRDQQVDMTLEGVLHSEEQVTVSFRVE